MSYKHAYIICQHQKLLCNSQSLFISPSRMEMDGVWKCQNQTSITEHEYAFCYIFIFIFTWAFGNGYLLTKIKSCTSSWCCSFGHMLVKLIALAYFVTLTGNGKSVTCVFPYVFT